eukprot:61265-Chlamydomonas_euryale.AAC.7
MVSWDNHHALFDEDCFKSIASWIFSGAKIAFAQDLQCDCPACIASDHPHSALLASVGIQFQLWDWIEFAVGAPTSL